MNTRARKMLMRGRFAASKPMAAWLSLYRSARKAWPLEAWRTRGLGEEADTDVTVAPPATSGQGFRTDDPQAGWAEGQGRVARSPSVEPAPPCVVEIDTTPLDIHDEAAVAAACNLSLAEILWPRQHPGEIGDDASAARWMLDRLRTDASLRRRFPKALSGGPGGDFAAWLADPEREGEGLGSRAVELAVGVREADFARRARDATFWSRELRQRCPLALLPPGRRALARWLFGPGRDEFSLTLEEIWWLLVSVAEDPEGELAKTFLVEPLWQQAAPHGITVFGRTGFARWLVQHYGLDADEAWLDPSRWPELLPADQQIRLAYFAEEPWRTAHPRALEEAASAAALLGWLASPEAGHSASLQAWCQGRLEEGAAGRLVLPGANLIGHFCYTSGLRVSLEALASGIKHAGGLVALRNMHTTAADEPRHAAFLGMEPYDVSVTHVQPEPFFASSFERALLRPRTPHTYRVAYWYWELEEVPPYWAKVSESVDEVWAATTFVAEALQYVCRRPVKTLFPGVELTPFERKPLEAFGLRGEGRFTFLFSFHMASIMERKNPLGLIEAFRRAFAPDEPADLVLKTIAFAHHKDELARLRAAAQGANVTILDRSLDPADTLALTDACDAYVSLHRSEGLGLTLAEAMLMGKPVIATRYSGNMDFMSHDDSLLVDFTMAPVGPGLAPYDAASLWAQPSTKHAAVLMRRLFDDPAYGRVLGERARLRALRQLSVKAAGQRVAARLAEIQAARRSPGPSR